MMKKTFATLFAIVILQAAFAGTEFELIAHDPGLAFGFISGAIIIDSIRTSAHELDAFDVFWITRISAVVAGVFVLKQVDPLSTLIICGLGYLVALVYSKPDEQSKDFMC